VIATHKRAVQIYSHQINEYAFGSKLTLNARRLLVHADEQPNLFGRA